MNIFKGRIDRKTYFFGFFLTLSITIALAIVCILPLAAIELIVPTFRDGGPTILDKLVLLIPAAFVGVASLSLIVRRAHDLGTDGLAWLIAFAAAVIIRATFTPLLFTILPLVVFAILGCLNGTPGPNRYGKKPHKKLKVERLYQF
jgi:uncharacterized membrane protein YhaH (DUF805 family)